MASVKDITAELMKSDLYEMLGIEHTAQESAIKKAYRKAALKCHPDKNPDDPKAAEMFMKLSKVLEILCDADARKTYDHLLKARQAAALRSREYDSKRKKLKDDLEARERAAEVNKTNIQQDMEKLQAEIERLRKQGSRQLEEEQALMREQLRREREELTRGTHAKDEAGDDSCRLKVKWKRAPADGVGEVYDQDKLTALFSKYGEVAAAVVSKKKSSALVEFCDPQAASRAAQLEKGSAENPVTVELVGQRRAQAAEPGRVSAAPTSAPPMSRSSFDTFESLVLRNLRQAEERRKLTEALQKEDS
ncbi:dnaJ homolog subfamily C member 17-like [Amphibalanus amphitrite]|uniref:dnaJ homolog subfamily C member 17-like n=1 Tax=Amphibalanus amphitrite TaxID=1232801 RepID=UPI001C92B047|nr:dnaJ homolog subfamily C member 17-like [Amphibalanus amphitrite]XP_043191151.1 dnaJ homolog subfamily C member 17-like [Amphibalanus amphitrite]XP_043191152.1 dnaJ homolog subfamily C member 17-like [Amphibalanus amphitrite]XP_043191153.1 dnaJ homolog subfamily C member 17-like [Amphibalanus amphitrite]XP_043191154.1 dnaJ homolog subfamily C member 17-like [Amphibalanus amphitrite]XP_043241000.1 dnaJ homolog subfamily C member 17-like [Amphibalanus amphitrite]XP_043241001.1 dnaJ homolog s